MCVEPPRIYGLLPVCWCLELSAFGAVVFWEEGQMAQGVFEAAARFMWQIFNRAGQLFWS